MAARRNCAVPQPRTELEWLPLLVVQDLEEESQ